jgi:hypothetical protein
MEKILIENILFFFFDKIENLLMYLTNFPNIYFFLVKIMIEYILLYNGGYFHKS